MKQDKIWKVYQNDNGLQAAGCRDGGRVDFFCKLIPPSVRVLNIGVAFGNLERRLAEKGADVHALDPSETSIADLRNSVRLGERAKVGYSQDLPFAENYFDYVVMTEVIEHLSDSILKDTIAEVSRVLKDGELFVESVPADENLTQGMVVCPHCGGHFHRWVHQQSFLAVSLRQVLAEQFKQASVKKAVFTDFETLDFKGKVSACLRWLQARLGKTGSNEKFYCSGEKAIIGSEVTTGRV